MPPNVAAVVGAGLATLHELDSVYGTEDLHDMLEIIAVRACNERLAAEAARSRDGDRS